LSAKFGGLRSHIAVASSFQKSTIFEVALISDGSIFGPVFLATLTKEKKSMKFLSRKFTTYATQISQNYHAKIIQMKATISKRASGPGKKQPS